jgi:hypothetical protein
VASILQLSRASIKDEGRSMSKRALLQCLVAGIATVIAVAGVLIYSIRTGVAPVTIPITALVLGPGLAATALVTTCSVVAPPPGPPALMRAVDIKSGAMDEPAESTL